jgi:hypothetical protein
MAIKLTNHAIHVTECRALRTKTSISPAFDLSAEVAHEQGARGGLRAAGARARRSARSSTRCPTSSPPPTSRRSSRAIAEAKRSTADRVGDGAHVIKTGLGPVLID